MSEQNVDLRSTWAVLRRHTGLLTVATLLGAATGMGLLVLAPPSFTSTSVVLLPAAAQSGSGSAGNYDAETQVLIVKSSRILSRAAAAMSPRLTEALVADRVSAEAPASAILHLTAEGPTAGQAEHLAQAVASSLVVYLEGTAGTLIAARRAQLQDRLDTLDASLKGVDAEIRKTTDRARAGRSDSAAGLADAAALSDLTAVRASTVLEIESAKQQIAGEGEGAGRAGTSASIIQSASPGRQSGYATAALIRVLGGAAALLVLTALLFILTNQRDPKLRSRDEIADAVGIPVVASLRTRRPRSAGAWVEVLHGYDPDNVDGWALRRLLHGLVPDAMKEPTAADPVALVVLVLSGDAGALAVAPQIASFAASTGTPTRFVAAQHHESAGALWAACSQGSTRDDVRPGLSVSTVEDAAVDAALSVRLVVLDRESPEPQAAVVAGATALLAVSSASATRRDLADAVVAADLVGLTVHGIVVANPDPLDRTTGRLAPVERRGSSSLPPTAISDRSGAGGSGAAGHARRPESRGRQR